MFLIIVVILIVSVRKCHKGRNQKTILQPALYPNALDVPLIRVGEVHEVRNYC